jgi:hypothetical protein
MQSRHFRFIPVELCLLLSLGCASTKMVKNWVYPETGPLHFEKVMALVLVQDPFVRREGEDEMVRQIRKAQAVASYTVLPDKELESEENVRRAVASSGVDGIVVMRPVYDQQEVTYVSGSYPTPYYSFWGYYGWAYPVVYSPGYYRSDRLVGVEVNVYDASNGKLVWSGLSQTTNPKDVKKTVAATAKAVRKAMRKYGFIT